jgi:hypothetical protein
MNIPNLPFLEKKNKSEYFLSLVLRDEKASAVVFEEINGKINVVGEHSERFKTSLEDATDDELLEVLDRAVSTAEKNLPPDTESQKTIFGVKYDWIEEGKIKPQFLAKLKKASDEMGFKPMGFLVIPEAISHLLQKEEGAPLTAILAEIGDKNVTVSIIKAGKIISTKTAPVSESLVTSVEKLLKHFNELEVLPTRIILFDGGREDLAQDFISHKWSKELPFLHVPQISALPANFDARAVLNGAAQQMGFEVLEGSLKAAEKAEISAAKIAPIAEMSEEDKTLAEAASEFGFVSDDIKDDDEKEEEKEIPSEPIIQKPTEDKISEEEPKTAVADNFVPRTVASVAVKDQLREIPDELRLKQSEKKPFPVSGALIFGGISGFIKKLNFGKILTILKAGGQARKLLLLGLVPLILLILYIYFAFLGRSSTITLDLKGNEKEETLNVTFSQSENTNADDNVIAAEFITVPVDGKKTTSTTGKKEVGDKAKGTVTMFNSNTTGVTIPTGTVIVASNDLKFVTDKAVTVASASGDIFSGTEPGKADVPVTAEKFGTNYNLPSNTKFTVEGSSSVAAKNDKAFSGGTKKEVKVVAKKDQDKLVADIRKQLEAEAKDEIQKKAQAGSVVLPNFISVEFDKRSFSKDVDDEANEVSLTATINYKGVSYKESDITTFAREKFGTDGKMEVNEGSVEASAEDLEEDGEDASAKLKLKVSLLPKLDEKEIVNSVKGKSTKEAIRILNQINEVNRVDVKLSPPIPFLPDRLPFSSGKIKIVINKNG